jgi:hypothetical protein
MADFFKQQGLRAQSTLTTLIEPLLPSPRSSNLN